MSEEQPLIPEKITGEEKPRESPGVADAFTPKLTERSREAIRGGAEKFIDRPKKLRQQPTQAPPAPGATPQKSGASQPIQTPKASDVKTPSGLGKTGSALGNLGTAVNIARHPKEAAGEAGRAVAGAAAKKAVKEAGKRALQLLTSETGVGPVIIEALDKLANLLKKIPGLSGFSGWAWKNKWLVIGLLILVWLIPGILFAAALGGAGGSLEAGGGAAILPTITDQALINEVLKNSNIKFDSPTARQEISEGHLQDSILQALLAAAKAGYNIHINAAWSRSHPSNPKSFHHRGLALDLDPAPGLQEFLYKNATTLKINELFGPLDGPGSPQVDNGQSFGGQIHGHKDHIHIATYP